MLPVELVHLVAGDLGGAGPFFAPGQAVTQAQDHPLARGHGPIETAVLPHFRGQVHDLAAVDGGARGHLRRGKRIELEGGGEARLLLEAVDPWAGMELDLGHVVLLGRSGPEGVRTRRAREPRRRRGRSARPSPGRSRSARKGRSGSVRAGSREWRSVVPSALASTRPWGMDRLPIAIDTARAVKALGNSSWIQEGAPPSGIGRATVLLRSPSTRTLDVEVAAALRHLRRQVGHPHLAFGEAIGEDGAVPVMGGVVARGWRRPVHGPKGQGLEASVHRGRGLEDPREPPRTVDPGLAPDQLLHGLFRLHPGSARLAPAAGAVQGHLESQTIAFRGRVAQHLLPLWSPRHDALLDDLRGVPLADQDVPDVGVEHLHAADADALHPLEVEGDALPRDVAVHPVPPDTRPGFGRRCPEAIGQGVGGLGERDALTRAQQARSNDDEPEPRRDPNAQRGTSYANW